MSSAGVGSLCFLKTNVTAPVYQDILEHFMLPSADQLFKDADFIFQQDLAPVHTAKCTRSWLNSFSSHVKAVTKSAYYHLKNIARIRCFVSSQDLEKLVHAFITSRVDYCNGLLTGQRRALDSCSSSRTLLPGSWLEPEHLSTSHQSSGPYTGFQLHLGLILKCFYSFINHSMA